MSHGEGSTIDLRVGVIGLGAMVGPIAGHVLAAGLAVHVLDPRPRRGEALHIQGATEADSPAALSAAVDVVLVVAPGDDNAFRRVLRGRRRVRGRRPWHCAAVMQLASPPDRPADSCRSGDGGERAGCRADRRRARSEGRSGQLARRRRGAGSRAGPAGPGAVVLLDPPPGCVGCQPGRQDRQQPHPLGADLGEAEALTLAAAYGLSVPAQRKALQDGPIDSRTLRELEQMRLTWHVKDLANEDALAQAVRVPLPVAQAVRGAMLETSVEGLARLLRTALVDPYHKKFA